MFKNICPACGITFNTRKTNKIYCSSRCYREMNRRRSKLEKQTGAEMRRQKALEEMKRYTKEAWEFLNILSQKQQEIILKKKTYCEACKITDDKINLLVHHVKYSPVEIVTLCTKCHGILHSSFLKNRKVRNHIIVDNNDIIICDW